MPDYHSVYLPTDPAKPRQRVRIGESVAFVHDIMDGPLPAEYDRCDVLYADLPWRAGYQAYNERVGVTDGRTYADFMAVVSDLVRAQPRPVVLVTGAHAKTLLPKAVQTLPVRMPVAHGQQAFAYLYGHAALKPMWEDTNGLLAVLARGYDCAGDFCCGYGRTARAFHQAGKRFVASDYNPQCIGYIAQHAPGWSVG